MNSGIAGNAVSLGHLYRIVRSECRVSCLVRLLQLAAILRLLGNFEYRIPIISDMVSVAAFADIGSAFNLKIEERSVVLQ